MTDIHMLSSGDLIADRRAEYARMFDESGDAMAAADVMRQALERAPDWAAGWFCLAGYEEKSGGRPAAIAALRTVLALDPADLFGAGLRLSYFGALLTPALSPSHFFERLFDDYADRFDHALVEQLDYTVPEQIAALIERRDAAHDALARFACVIDLGCGTGLFGACIRDRANRLEGFDLSVNMLAKARDKRIYDHLGVADLSLPPDACGLFQGTDAMPHRADLVVAADVLTYLGRLESLFLLVSRLLCEKGFYAFSIEDAGAQGDIVLRETLRTAHGEAYVEGLCTLFGLRVLEKVKTVLRKDGGKSVPGILFLAQKTM